MKTGLCGFETHSSYHCFGWCFGAVVWLIVFVAQDFFAVFVHSTKVALSEVFVRGLWWCDLLGHGRARRVLVDLHLLFIGRHSGVR